MLKIRQATLADAALITGRRHAMFAENGLATEARLTAMDASFTPWVAARLAEGRYIGLLAEEHGTVLAGAGVSSRSSRHTSFIWNRGGRIC